MIVWPGTMTVVTVLVWILSHLILSTITFILVTGTTGALAYRCTIGSHVQAKRQKWRIRFYLHPGEGFASRTELFTSWGRTRAAWEGGRVRPGLSFPQRLLLVPATSLAIRLGRGPYGHVLWVSAESAMIIIAPPRTFKTIFLAGRILDWHGPGVAVTTKADLLNLTGRQRAALGDLYILNPLGVGGIPGSLHYDAIAGCRDPQTAARKAQCLVRAGEQQHASGENDLFLRQATGLIAAYLHAADLAGQRYTIEDVAAWVSRTDQDIPDTILRNPKVSRAIHALAEYSRKEGRTENSIRIVAGAWLAWTAIPELAAAVTPAPGEPVFVPEDFVSAGAGTVYMIARSSVDAGLTSAVYTMILEEIHYAALIAASMQDRGKLSPQLGYFLDEADRTIAVSVPDMTADSSGHGIQVSSVFQSYAAVQAAWGEHGAAKLLQNSGTLMLLGGGKEAGVAEAISTLAGSGEGQNARPVITPAFLRKLPRRWAFVLHGNLDPVVVRLRPVWKRRDYRRPPAIRPAAARVARPEGQVTGIGTPLEPYMPPQAALSPANGNGHGSGARHG